MRLIALFLVLTAGLVIDAPTVEAQGAGKEYKIGFLSANRPQGGQVALQSFLKGLRDHRYVEGRDFVMEYRWAEGHQDRLPELATQLVQAQVHVIVTAGTPATYAAMQATKIIPIVFGSAGAVVEKGIVASLTRPGGNVTGLTYQLGRLKLYQILTEAVPATVRGVYLYDPEGAPPQLQERLRSEGKAVNVEWQAVPLRDEPNGVAQAFGEIGRGPNGLVLEQSVLLQMKANEICNLAMQRRLPAIGLTRTFADAGCLMSYAERTLDMYWRAAGLVDKILKGAKPGDLPVEQPTKFELVINLKTAKALGLTIPQSVLVRADEIIQ